MSAVRIVGGVWRRTPVLVPQRPGLRPTPDRVRETLFNWLGQSLADWRVLDVFAGSGVLGLEAASRGAAEVVLLESDGQAAGAIGRQLARLQASTDAVARDAVRGVELRRGDSLGLLPALAREQRRFDLILLDPPFGQGWLARVRPLLVPVLAPTASVYAESDSLADLQDLAAGLPRVQGVLRVRRMGRAGRVHYHLFDYRLEHDPDSPS